MEYMVNGSYFNGHHIQLSLVLEPTKPFQIQLTPGNSNLKRAKKNGST